MVTQSYDARFLAAAIDQQRRDLAYASDPARATLDVLDAEDLAIARLARERFATRYDIRSPDVLATYWSLSATVRWARCADAVLERHPNPRGAPCGG